MPALPQLRYVSRSAYAGMALADYNPGDVPLATYELMRQRDPIIRYAYSHLKRSLRRRMGDYAHDDPRVKEWVDANVLPTVMRDLPRLQKALYYGVALAQPRYELAGGQLRLAELCGVPQARFWDGLGFGRDDGGRVNRVAIDGMEWVPFVDPESGVRQIIHYATGDEDGGPWGEATARVCYPSWFIKSNLTQFEAMALERHATGTGVLKVDDDDTNEATGRTHSEEVAEQWAQMGALSFIAIDKADELSIITPGWQTNSPFDPVLRRLDAAIFNSFFMPYLLTQEAQMGTRSTAGVQVEMYLMAETDLAEELADQVIIEQIIAPAVALQFGPNVGPGSLTVRDPAPPDLEAWSTILQALDGIGAFSAEAKDQLAFVGERFGLPMDDIMRINASADVAAAQLP